MRTRPAVFLLVFFTFCSLVTGADESVIYLRLSDITSLDPGKTTDTYSGEVVANIFEGLVEYRRDTRTFVPQLATKWRTANGGRQWIFTLRQGVRFHNGRPFNAEDVIYSFLERMKRAETEYPQWKLLFSNATRVRALGKFTVEFTLRKPYAPFLASLIMPGALVVPRGAYDSPDFLPIGTGPFKFSDRAAGDRIVLTRNERYWGKKVAISKVVIKMISNPAHRIRHIKSGQAHVIGLRSANEYQELIGNREIQILTATANNTTYIAFNTRKPPFDRRMVRRAVAHLIDKKTLIRQIFQNFAIPAATPLPPQVFGFNPRISHHPFDLERARSLLKQAGIRGGFSCKFLFLKDDEGERRIADAFVRNAALIGIEIEKDAKPFPEIMRTLRAGSHDILLRGWNAGPDPDLFLFTNFTMDPGNSNRAYYSNTELTRLLRSARETLDPKKRRDMYHRIQEIIFTDVPWIPLYHRHDLIVHNIRLKHLFLNANSFLIFRDTLWERQEE